MYVILTTKPGTFRTEFGPDEGVTVLEVYDYVFYGKIKAVFSIACLERDIKLVVTEDAPPHTVNRVPSKFLEKFESIEAARRELAHLTQLGSIQSELVRHG